MVVVIVVVVGVVVLVAVGRLRRGGDPQLTVVRGLSGVVAVIAAGAVAAAVATGASSACAVVGVLGGSVGAGIGRLGFRDFVESVDSSERFIGCVCNGAVFDLVGSFVSFCVAFACLEFLVVGEKVVGVDGGA